MRSSGCDLDELPDRSTPRRCGSEYRAGEASAGPLWRPTRGRVKADYDNGKLPFLACLDPDGVATVRLIA